MSFTGSRTANPNGRLQAFRAKRLADALAVITAVARSEPDIGQRLQRKRRGELSSGSTAGQFEGHELER